jgi:CheY-like chemotaxis protein
MLDIAMQGMDGLELARQIRKKFGDDIGLVAITGAAVDDLRYKATFETVDHYFEKPVTLQQIQKLFSPWINGRANPTAWQQSWNRACCQEGMRFVTRHRGRGHGISRMRRRKKTQRFRLGQSLIQGTLEEERRQVQDVTSDRAPAQSTESSQKTIKVKILCVPSRTLHRGCLWLDNAWTLASMGRAHARRIDRHRGKTLIFSFMALGADHPTQAQGTRSKMT